MKSSKSANIPKLPLSNRKRLNELVKLINKQRTYVGQTLAKLMETRSDITDPAVFAGHMLRDPEMLTMHEGYLYFLGGWGIPVSADQLIEWDAIAYAYPYVDFSDHVKQRTFSFGSFGNEDIKKFFNQADSMHVFLIPTLIKSLRKEWEAHDTNNKYEVEFVTTSNISMIYQVMQEAGLTGQFLESLRECPLAENSLECDPEAPKRNIAAEELKFKKAVSDAMAANLFSAMSSGEETRNDISTVEGVL